MMPPPPPIQEMVVTEYNDVYDVCMFAPKGVPLRVFVTAVMRVLQDAPSLTDYDLYQTALQVVNKLDAVMRSDHPDYGNMPLDQMLTWQDMVFEIREAVWYSVDQTRFTLGAVARSIPTNRALSFITLEPDGGYFYLV